MNSITIYSMVRNESLSRPRLPQCTTGRQMIEYIQNFDTICSWAILKCWHVLNVLYRNHWNVLHTFMYLFLTYTPVMSIKTAFSTRLKYNIHQWKCLKLIKTVFMMTYSMQNSIWTTYSITVTTIERFFLQKIFGQMTISCN